MDLKRKEVILSNGRRTPVLQSVKGGVHSITPNIAAKVESVEARGIEVESKEDDTIHVNRVSDAVASHVTQNIDGGANTSVGEKDVPSPPQDLDTNKENNGIIKMRKKGKVKISNINPERGGREIHRDFKFQMGNMPIDELMQLKRDAIKNVS
jgi:hypothetical protein